MQNESTVGERIRASRKAVGMTQEALANAVGVTRSAVAQWETERSGQVGANLTRVAAALGVSVAALLSGEDRFAGAAENATEMALLRLYRECGEEDRAFLLRTARRMALQAAKERHPAVSAGEALRRSGNGG